MLSIIFDSSEIESKKAFRVTKPNPPIPLKEGTSLLSRVEFICTDVDDTITTDGKLLPEAYAALWSAKRAGFKIVIVTGRPAGWADQMARFWPVDAVVCENGALTFYMDESEKPPRMQRLWTQDESTIQGAKLLLEKIKEDVLKEVPAAKVAFDQPFRFFDLAIDFAEDVSPLSKADVQKISEVFKKHGATSKVSSIHVNGWFGEFDKFKGLEKTFQTLWGLDLTKELDRAIYVGDSPNDEPLFQKFKLSVGVRNVEAFLSEMKSPPKFITQNPGGLGFSELISLLVSI